MGALRLVVGLGLLVAPRFMASGSDPSLALLIRTVGIRDAVLGLGSVLAEPGQARLWAMMTLASDTLDVIAGTAAIPAVGLRGGLTAALVPLPFVAAGLWALSTPARGRVSKAGLVT